MLLVSIITFSESAYSVDESSGTAQVTVVLSNPLSNDLIVEIMNSDVTASGEHYAVYIHKHLQLFIVASDV